MRILCVGDVVGSAGCRHLRQVLPGVKRHYGVDVCVVNGENSADGNGITPVSLEHILQSGADVVTAGNHTYRRREIYELLEQRQDFLRPANYPDTAPGRGISVVDRGRYQVTVINLMGVVYMEPLACPFETLGPACLGRREIRNSASWISMRKRLRKRRRWDIMPTDGFRRCLAPIRMCRRPTNRSCRVELVLSPMPA